MGQEGSESAREVRDTGSERGAESSGMTFEALRHSKDLLDVYIQVFALLLS